MSNPRHDDDDDVAPTASDNPFERDSITERLPAWELWEDGVKPGEEPNPDPNLDRAA
jgi:hypothetical protein